MAGPSQCWRGGTRRQSDPDVAIIWTEPCALERPTGRLIFEPRGAQVRWRAGNSAPIRRSPGWSNHVDEAVRELAEDAGIANEWTDAAGHFNASRLVRYAASSPRLDSGDTKTDIEESRGRLRDLKGNARTFATATMDERYAARRDASSAELILEDGATLSVALRQLAGPPSCRGKRARLSSPACGVTRSRWRSRRGVA